MFRCGYCNQLSQPGEGAIRVIVDTRGKEYPERLEAKKNRRGEWIKDPGGRGWEIVREELRHQSCVLADYAVAIP